MDVKALYTNIPNNKSIADAKEKCDNYTKKSVATKVITTFLALTLTFNNFIFNSKFYLQIKGCAMRIICGPTYANYLCPSSKRDTSILSLKTNLAPICASSMILLWYEPNKRTNLNAS